MAPSPCRFALGAKPIFASEPCAEIVSQLRVFMASAFARLFVVLVFLTTSCGPAPVPDPSPVCGNGKIGEGEECDDGNQIIGDGCTASCKIEIIVTAIALGGFHTCALLNSGAVRCWGDNGYGQLGDGTPTQRRTPVSVRGITDASAIALGGTILQGSHTCALLDAGAVRCWGWNEYGQLGDGTTTDRHTPVEVRILD